MKRIFTMALSILLFCCAQKALATADTSVKVPFGNWADTNTWKSKIIPSNTHCVDTILINTKVYIGSQISVNTCDSIVFIVEDTLVFKNGFKLDLPAGSAFIVRDSGYVYPEGSGNSNQIFIGSVEYWRSSDGPLHGNVYLDVTYVKIEVSHSDGTTSIRWTTASETNNDYFIIEESENGAEFIEVGRVRGAGNSAAPVHYRFELPGLLDRTKYYRLTQVDYDGSRESSRILPLHPDAAANIKIWVDHKTLNVDWPDAEFETGVSYELVQTNGLSLTIVKAGKEVDLSGYSPGIYYCLIWSDQGLITARPFVLH